jgi:hypothetical protein
MTQTRTDDDSDQRLQKILQGAFSGPPTPLKDIPTRWGKLRASPKKKKSQRPRRRRKARAA